MFQIEFFSDNIELIRQTADRLLDPKTRSQHEQFLTAVPIARYMASRFSQQQIKDVRLLDAGKCMQYLLYFCNRLTKP